MIKKKFPKWLIRAGIISLGAILGFGYYYYIGCRSGACPLTSNPWISTGYGAVLALLISGSFKSDPPKNKETS